jgi:hypothetical protein
MRKHFRVPPFAKNAKDGAPIFVGDASEIKAWATRPNLIYERYWRLFPSDGPTFKNPTCQRWPPIFFPRYTGRVTVP